MYQEYWGLKQHPFSNIAAERFYLPTAMHAESFARLAYVIEQRRAIGFLTGPAGSGKSMLLSRLAEFVRRSQRLLISIDLTGLDSEGLLRQLAHQLRLWTQRDETPCLLWERVSDQLSGRDAVRLETVLLFDHDDRAGCCSAAIQRLLALTRFGDESFMTMIGAGQKESELFGSFSSRRLRIELTPLQQTESAKLVTGALRNAGCDRDLFDEEALSAIHRYSRGIPGDICFISDLALLSGMAERRQTIGADIVQNVAGRFSAPRVRPESLVTPTV